MRLSIDEERKKTRNCVLLNRKMICFCCYFSMNFSDTNRNSSLNGKHVQVHATIFFYFFFHSEIVQMNRIVCRIVEVKKIVQTNWFKFNGIEWHPLYIFKFSLRIWVDFFLFVCLFFDTLSFVICVWLHFVGLKMNHNRKVSKLTKQNIWKRNIEFFFLWQDFECFLLSFALALTQRSIIRNRDQRND